MKKCRLNLTKVSLFVAMYILMATVFIGCGKDEIANTNENGSSKFKPSDFKITNIVSTINSNGSDLNIRYDQINTTSMNYDWNRDGSFEIKWTVKTTDGSQYQSIRLLETVDAKATSAENTVIEITPGKIVDKTTLKYEVYSDN